MEPKVAKIKTSFLRSSNFILARKMATKSEVKYLTEKQAQQLKRYGLIPEYMSSSERKEVNLMFKKKREEEKIKKGIQNSSYRVTFADDEGIHKITFNSLLEATNWIDFQESQRSTGECFKHISTERISNKILKRKE